MDQKQDAGARPVYATISDWTKMSGVGRTKTFALLASGELKAVKAGKRTLIHVASGIDYLDALPAWGQA
jgi:hypothetical protein